MATRRLTIVWTAMAAALAGGVLILLVAGSWKRSMDELERRIERATERANRRFEKTARELKNEIERERARPGIDSDRI